MKNFQVAIDGPAGSGKSSISKLVSKKLKFNHLDTGAMYRGIGYFLDKCKVDVTNKSNVISALDGIDMSIKYFVIKPNNISCLVEDVNNIVFPHFNNVSTESIG